ncbi:TetR/AcrR family transcriptional regulator [Streptomyces sp. UH6]|uniref:TetR/AcrR family transcriptional regulator n=1 Tax=Streptomyces sp. UH6 TaxID=2748379 RepID=UPI0015D513B2|nr:TetR family transcriptional regulator [Streptomyces sp. UH6]NYV72786.1 TetR family transcriptional regulator [Streptomyces sp. UH6]
MTETDSTGPKRSRRDPEARRRAIVQAAAELLMGSGDLTHRQVAERAGVPLGATTYYFATLGELREAALAQLADSLNNHLARIADEVAAANGDATVLAGQLHAYLSDVEQVRADAALYSSAAQDPALRHLALRWFDGFIQLTAALTDPTTARNIAVYVEGASLHATLTGKPLDLPTLTSALTALLRAEGEGA